MFRFLEYETSEGIATVRLARPEVRNALSEELLEELLTALDRAERDEDVYVLILTGEGTAFSAGGDLDEVTEWQTESRESFERGLKRFQRVIKRLRTMGTPSIAAVNGPAVGAGCDLTLACDFRIVAPEAELSEGFINVGLVSGDGGAWLLQRLVGEAKAKEYLLTGKGMNAAEAVDIGLAVTQTEDVEARAVELAEHLRNLPRAAVRETKKLGTTTAETIEDHFDRATEAQWTCLQDSEHREMLESRLDDRPPHLDRPE